MKKIKVKFDTLTPIWSGDAWGDNKEIRPSSLMGSLRFWFEVICYFARITNEKNYENGKLKDDVNEKELKKKILVNGSDFNGINKSLAELGVTLPSRVFGCTGWKGWVRIKNITKINEDRNNRYDFPTGRVEFRELKYKKGDKIITPTWYFKRGFSDSFDMVLEVEENILNPIFYPLMNFMDQYGFWGGKWNIGYGRLKVEDIEIKEDDKFIKKTGWKKDKFELSIFNGDFKDEKISDIVGLANDFAQLEQKGEKIIYLKSQVNTTNAKGIIKDLIRIKSQQRTNHKNKVKDDELRHLLFGTVKSPPNKNNLPQGTKIIPWIYEEDGKLNGGFVSIAGILNLGGKK